MGDALSKFLGLVLGAALACAGCSGRTDCIMRYAGSCNGSPTHACQDACEKENQCRSQDTSRVAEEETGRAEGETDESDE